MLFQTNAAASAAVNNHAGVRDEYAVGHHPRHGEGEEHGFGQGGERLGEEGMSRRKVITTPIVAGVHLRLPGGDRGTGGGGAFGGGYGGAAGAGPLRRRVAVGGGDGGGDVSYYQRAAVDPAFDVDVDLARQSGGDGFGGLVPNGDGLADAYPLRLYRDLSDQSEAEKSQKNTSRRGDASRSTRGGGGGTWGGKLRIPDKLV